VDKRDKEIARTSSLATRTGGQFIHEKDTKAKDGGRGKNKTKVARNKNVPQENQSEEQKSQGQERECGSS